MNSLIIKILGGLVGAAILFTLGHGAGVRAERHRTDPKVTAICAAAGSTWDRKGVACLAQVKGLATFKVDAIAASAKALQDAQAEQAEKDQADQLAARRDAETQRKAQQNMEKADAAVRDDRVDGDWLRALGGLGGLREPEAAAPDRAGGARRGAPAR